MRVFSVILMIFGFLLFCLGLADDHSYSIALHRNMIVAISGSIIFGSGAIALTITETFGKK